MQSSVSARLMRASLRAGERAAGRSALALTLDLALDVARALLGRSGAQHLLRRLAQGGALQTPDRDADRGDATAASERELVAAPA